MNLRNRTGRASALATFSLLCLPACGAQDISIPRSICDTPVEQRLTTPAQTDGEIDRVAHRFYWGGKETSVCIISVDKSEALRLRFAWHTDTIDTMKYSSLDNSVTGLWEPRRVPHLAESATLGDNGAIATTRCKGRGKWHFTLALKVTRDRKIVHQRNDIEQFMRAYMPATMKAVGCTHP